MEAWFKWVVGLLLAALGTLIGIVWKTNEDKHRDAAAARKELANDLRMVEAESVSRDTIINIQNDWKDEISLLREERRQNHEDNSRRFDRLEDKIDRLLTGNSGVR
jgi:hypothetical protein